MSGEGATNMTATNEHRSPSQVDERRGWFDEFASKAHDLTSRNIFFVVVMAVVAVWAPTYFLFDSLTHWYITFMLPSGIITLLLVALLENHSRRSEQALHRKLDAFAAALAAIVDESSSEETRQHATELRAAIGLQDRERTDDEE